MTDRPLLLLDIDGVLNAIPGAPSPPGYTVHEMDGFPIHLHVDLREMVSTLAEHFDIFWFTLWNERAAMLMGPHVGLETAPHLPTSWRLGERIMLAQGYPPSALAGVLYAKSPILTRQLDRAQPWIWIDDAHSRDDHAYLVREGFDPADFRLLRTDERVGLTWADVERAIAWLPRLGRSAEGFDAEGGPHHGPDSTADRADAVGE